MDILEQIAERKFFLTIEPMSRLATISKLLINPMPAIYVFQMIGALMLNIGYLREAFLLFEVARDLAHDAQHLSEEMICYEWMGRTK